MSAKILAIENYTNDAFSCIFSNCVEAVRRKKEKEEMSVWGPIEIPVQSKKNSAVNQCYPTKICESEIVNDDNAAFNVKSSLLPQKKKVFLCHDSIGNYSSKLVHQGLARDYMNSSKIIETKILTTTDNIYKDDKHIPKISLHCEQVPQNDINNFAQEAQNAENFKISSIHCDQKLNFGGSLGSNLSDNHNIMRARFVENVNSDHLEMESVSSKFKNMTKNIYEDTIAGNSSENLRHINAKASSRSKFVNWCDKRKREYKGGSYPTQSDLPISKVMVTEIDHSNMKSASKNEYEDVFLESEKQNTFECTTSFENNKEGNCTVGRFLRKTNLSHKKDDYLMENSITDLKQMLINAENKTSEKEEIVCSKFYDTKYQNSPEIIDENYSENNLQFSVEVSNDEKKAMAFIEQHHDTNPNAKIVENVLNINTKETVIFNKKSKQIESSKYTEFVTEAYNRSKSENEYKGVKPCNPKFNRNWTCEIPPRFRKNEVKNENVRHKKESVSKNIHSGNKLLNENLKTSQKREQIDFPLLSKSVYKDHCCSDKEKTQLCIRITDEKCNKNFELMADSVRLSRIKKTFPKLSSYIPDVDKGSKEIHYSADALNIILRFVFCPSFKICMPAVVTGVEVLAAAQAWNATEFYKLFIKEFLRSVLTSANAALIFSYAIQYNLKEVVDACKNIYPDNAALGNISPRKRQKMCLVTISTYIEPLEITIPFEPTETSISASFKKGISNKFTFKADLGCYSITGFQIQLNEEYILKKDQREENKSMLEIDYTIKNVNSGDQKIGRERKPLRSIIIIYFEKSLVIKPREVGEITVEAEIEPYLCSTHQEEKIRIRSSVGELDLIMTSNWEVPNSDGKSFLVGNFFYHVTKFPKDTEKQ